MKIKYSLLFLGIIFILMAGIGLFFRLSYADFNKEENPESHFLTAMLHDDLLDIAMAQWESLEDSPIIIAAKCEEKYFYRFSTITQKVTVERVFKGENEIKKGDSVNIGKNNSHIYLGSYNLIEGYPQLDMGFVNEMIPGKTYLIFLERKLKARANDNIYIQSDPCLVAPIFCYEEIENKPYISIDDWNSTYALYDDMKENEFFLMSEEAITRVGEFKKKIIEKYAY